MEDVTVIGGGIAGMLAALRLAERGCRVTLLERAAELGGKLGARADLSSGARHEHAYHMYLNWYGNFWDAVDQLGIRSRFLPRRNISFLKAGEFPRTTQLTDVGALETVWKNVSGGVLPAPDMFIYSYSLLDLIAERYDRDSFLHRVSVNGFMGARGYATDAAAEQHSRTLAKAFASYSYRTSAASYRKFIAYGAAQPSPMMWVLDGDVHDRLIQPLEGALTARGVRIRKNTQVDRIALDRNGHVHALDVSQLEHSAAVNHVQPRVTGKGTLPAGGSVICTVPPGQLAQFVDDSLYAASPSLHSVARLRSEPMASISLHFKRRLANIPNEHVVLSGARYELTFVDNSQMWGGYDHTYLNVVASDADHYAHLAEPTALASVLGELARYVPFQLEDVDFARTRIRYNEDAPLFVNEVGSWLNRPETRTAIPNLFLAGDFCRHEIDVVTIEGAIVSALNAAQAVLDRGPSGERLRIRIPREFPRARAQMLKTLLTPHVYWAKNMAWWSDISRR